MPVRSLYAHAVICSSCIGSWSGAFRAAAQIYGENGVRGLLQGHSATLLRIFPYAAIKFMAYDQLEHVRPPSPVPQRRLTQTDANAYTRTTN